MKKVLEQAVFETGNSGFAISIGTQGGGEKSYRLSFEQSNFGTYSEMIVPLAHPHVVEYMIFALTKTLAHMQKNKFEGEYLFQQNMEKTFQKSITMKDGVATDYDDE